MANFYETLFNIPYEEPIIFNQYEILKKLLKFCEQVCENLGIEPYQDSEFNWSEDEEDEEDWTPPELCYCIKNNYSLNFTVYDAYSFGITLIFNVLDNGTFMLHSVLCKNNYHSANIMLGVPCIETLQAVIALYKLKLEAKYPIDMIAQTLRESIRFVQLF